MQPIVIIEAPRRLDATAAPEFGKFVVGLVEAGASRLILDFAAVAYLGSAGVRALLLVRKSITERKGRIALMACHPSVSEVLQICGLGEGLPQVEVVEDARQCV